MCQPTEEIWGLGLLGMGVGSLAEAVVVLREEAPEELMSVAANRSLRSGAEVGRLETGMGNALRWRRWGPVRGSCGSSGGGIASRIVALV